MMFIIINYKYQQHNMASFKDVDCAYHRNA